jgi:hypothetical protein
MAAQPQPIPWTIRQEHDAAAALCAQRAWQSVSVSCRYDAASTAMGVALHDPPHGPWSHAGIRPHWTRGPWRRPSAPLDRAPTRAIRRRSNACLPGQCGGERSTGQDSADAVRSANEVLGLVARAFGFSGRFDPQALHRRVIRGSWLQERGQIVGEPFPVAHLVWLLESPDHTLGCVEVDPAV